MNNNRYTIKLLGQLSIALLFIAVFNSSVNAQQNTKMGILVLAHGSNDTTWNNTIHRVVAPIKKEYKVEVAFGMANSMTMQAGIDKLETAGINEIVVVPLFVSSYSPIIRQNEYLLGLRDKLADKPMPIMHGMHGGGKMRMEFPETLDQLDFSADIILTKPLDDHPLVVEIIMDRIKSVSTNPEKETILLVAHGPNSDADNKSWVKTIENIGNQIEQKYSVKGESFKDIISLTVRDDADPEVYEAAKQEFRSYVSEADKNGEAIVIPILLSKGGVEARYLNRLEGLDYTWSGETILPHKNITQFIQVSIEEALATRPSN